MEYRLNCGNYRHFVVEAENTEQAKKRFQDAYNHDTLLTNGFQVKDITSIQALNKVDKR